MYKKWGYNIAINILQNDIIHLGLGSAATSPIATTPMIESPLQTNNHLVVDKTSIHSPNISVVIGKDIDIFYYGQHLLSLIGYNGTTLCMNTPDVRGVYGLGQKFTEYNSENNWMGRTRMSKDMGNGIENTPYGPVGDIQIPIAYFVRSGSSYAIFVDSINKVDWSLGITSTITTPSSRIFILCDTSLLGLRCKYISLTGRPKLPSIKLCGLWISEYGYRNFSEVDSVVTNLQKSDFPLEGVVLDLQWFGGVNCVGTLRFDTSNFANPKRIIEQYNDAGTSIMLIEHSYMKQSLIDNTIRYVTKHNKPTIIDGDKDFLNNIAMIDWTDRLTSKRWNQQNRSYLNDMGVYSHWLDLGDPQYYDKTGSYVGLNIGGIMHTTQKDIHNIYNLLWVGGVADYYKNRPVRPVILTRSGTAGIQRYGLALWCGDVFESYETLKNIFIVQNHMYFSGIDYYGSDIGGFIKKMNDSKLYTIWFANSSLTDFPIRPHCLNLEKKYTTSPAEFGDVRSNLYNIRLRYFLLPYYYSLMYLLSTTGMPIISPLLMHFPEDTRTFGIYDQKMIGNSIMIKQICSANTYTDVYLPAGRWYMYKTCQCYSSNGRTIHSVPVVINGVITPPIFIRAGAIIPVYTKLNPDSRNKTFNMTTLQKKTTIRIYPSRIGTSFLLYEDNGLDYDYNNGKYNLYRISQIKIDKNVHITVDNLNHSDRLLIFEIYNKNQDAVVEKNDLQILCHQKVKQYIRFIYRSRNNRTCFKLKRLI